VANNHYLDNDFFLKELIEHKNKCNLAKDAGLDAPTISNYLGKAFLLLVNNIIKKADYSNYPIQVREDMVSDAILNCIQYINSFKAETSSNPFSYFTMIIHRAFWRRIEKERKRLYQKYKYIENSGIMDEEGLYEDSDVEHQYDQYDNISNFIRIYEENEIRKKLNKKQSKLEKFFE